MIYKCFLNLYLYFLALLNMIIYNGGYFIVGMVTLTSIENVTYFQRLCESLQWQGKPIS